MQRYEYKAGRSFPVPADVVGKAVDRIAKRDGTCPPLALVEAARKESSDLHPLFDWDDASAAGKHRLLQARQVINSLRIITIKREGVISPPAFLSVSVTRGEEESDDADGYMSQRQIAREPDLRKATVLREWAYIRGWIERTAWIEEFAPLRSAAEEIERTLADQPETVAA